MAAKLIVVVGGQFGSEGKGAVAGHLATTLISPLVVRTGGPNAGHTVVDQIGQTYKLRQLPTAAITNSSATLALAAGSLVDLEVLEKEMIDTGADVWIDPSATLLEPKHQEAELADPAMQWGSTRKGVGAARADRIHRTARVWGETNLRLGAGLAASIDVATVARRFLDYNRSVLIEAAQGYGLGLHTQYYPKTTSADCRAIDALADVGISPWALPGWPPTVWVVVRPYPIRVVGDSGPLRDETSWEALGLPEERTTVTNKVRRVGGWDPELVTAAITANGGDRCKVWFSMADQVVPELKGFTHFGQLLELPAKALQELENWLALIGQCGAKVCAIGTGPATAIVLGQGFGIRGSIS